jgi:surface antigen
VLRADNADLQKISSGKDQQLVQLTALNTTLNSQIGGLNLQIVDEQKACSTQVTAIKATAAKSKRNWFLTGLGIGGTVAAYLVLTL